MPTAQCRHAYECGKLYSALEVMEAMAIEGDSVVKAMARTFLFRLGLHGYEYGRLPHHCSVSLKREKIRELTHEAIEILDGMTLRSRPGKAFVLVAEDEAESEAQDGVDAAHEFNHRLIKA